MLLHTVNKSPFDRSTLEACLGHAVKGSSILLIEDGVVAAMKGTSWQPRLAAAMKDVAVYALAPDLKARGLDPANVVEGVKVVDYAGFVDLTAEHHAVQAWL